ncbi:hypothetical protein A9Q68_08475 [Streptococcus bovimastitidis]|uniref:DUF1351 domain-containing protein n=1 Tax=Streptococcus bovimastitidis TaxID=1856638 RepID=A0A1L8MKM1_9STRE|nr:DUF1351 domain-containing protein [Streptococcus bovimastitidis]OJF71225.1 hypothetical protein A9Q68_08475 [Streptococcus bovimastitidis]
MAIKEAEKVNALDSIEINYTPAVVSFNDFEAFEKGVEEAVARYSTFDLEVNTIEEVKQARTELNALDKKLEDRRKEIKREINDPYAKFENQYKVPYQKLKNLISELKNQIDGYEENQKMLRKDKVKHYFYEKAEEANLNKEVFDKYLDQFVKATDFTPTFNFKKSTQDKLDEIIIDEIKKQDQRDADLIAITDLCAKNNLGPASYIRQYDNGASLAEILGLINRDIDEIKRTRELNEAKRIADEKAMIERQAAIEAQAKEIAGTTIKAVNQETGEILERTVETEIVKYETTIKFIMNLEQAKNFKSFLDENDFEFETLVGMKRVN